MKQVVLNADDFGFHPDINTGIERAFREGLVRSASLMTGCDGTDHAVKIARRCPDLDLGLHFCLVGVPNTPATLSEFVTQRFTGQITSKFISQALHSQLQEMTETHGLLPSHLDSHQHLHALPFVMRIISHIAPKYGIKHIRLPLESNPSDKLPLKRRVQAAALFAAAGLARKYLVAAGLHTTDHFAGMAVSGHLSNKRLVSMLSDIKPGTTEIVCHPAVSNAALGKSTEWGYDWERELAAICSSHARETLAAQKIQLCSWRDFNIL